MDKVQLLAEICALIVEANKFGYAGLGSGHYQKADDGSFRFRHNVHFPKSGHWEYRDRFVGGEPFGGVIEVSLDRKIIWMMFYHGSVAEEVFPEDKPKVLEFLQAALRKAPSEFPCRGPEHFQQGPFQYRNDWFGQLDRFNGSEVIRDFKDPVFHCNYVGGLVDQRPD